MKNEWHSPSEILQQSSIFLIVTIEIALRHNFGNNFVRFTLSDLFQKMEKSNAISVFRLLSENGAQSCLVTATEGE